MFLTYISPKKLIAFTPFPVELLELYKTVGFGFMNRRKNIDNCIIDPMSLVYINKQEGYLATERVKQKSVHRKGTKYVEINITNLVLQINLIFMWINILFNNDIYGK